MFAPVNFSKFGKSASDLLKEPKYELSAKTTTKPPDGFKFETSGVSSDKGISGSSKVTYASQTFDVEGNLDTTGKSADVKVTLNNLHPETKVSVKANLAGKDLAEVEVTYTPKDFVVAAVTGAYRTKGAFLGTVNAAIGSDGLSVGVQYQGKFDNGKFESRDFNAGFQYAGSGFTASLFGKVGKENDKNGTYEGGNCENVALSYFHRIRKGYDVAAQFDVDKAKDPVLTLGLDYELDAKSSLKLSAKTDGVVHAKLTHTLKEPSIRFALASQLDATKLSFVPKKFGLSADFGSF